MLEFGHYFGVTERILEIHEIEHFLNAFTGIFVTDTDLDKVYRHINDTLVTRDLPEVFDIVHSLWMKDLVTAKHCWIDGTKRGCVCGDTMSEGSVSDESHEQQNLDDIADEVDVANIMPDPEFGVRPCRIVASIEALMFALDELIEPETFKERARLLPYIERDSDSETISDGVEDIDSEMAE